MRLAWQDKEIRSFYVFTSVPYERMLFLFLWQMLTSVNGDENKCPAAFTIRTCTITNYLKQ